MRCDATCAVRRFEVEASLVAFIEASLSDEACVELFVRGSRRDECIYCCRWRVCHSRLHVCVTQHAIHSRLSDGIPPLQKQILDADYTTMDKNSENKATCKT